MRGNLILFDVDGTIITEDNYIPASAVNAIRAAQQAGNLCFVNTGRPYSHIDPTVPFRARRRQFPAHLPVKWPISPKSPGYRRNWPAKVIPYPARYNRAGENIQGSSVLQHKAQSR